MELLFTLMPETLTERLAALTGVVVSLALFFFAFSARREETVVPVAASTDAPTAAPVDATVPETVAPAATRPVAPPPSSASTASLVLTATRGDCWVSLRSGSADGKVLYEGVLVSGRTIRANAPRLWIRLGAAANVDLMLNGKQAPALPAGTIDVVATPKGIAPAT